MEAPGICIHRTALTLQMKVIEDLSASLSYMSHTVFWVGELSSGMGELLGETFRGLWKCCLLSEGPVNPGLFELLNQRYLISFIKGSLHIQVEWYVAWYQSHSAPLGRTQMCHPASTYSTTATTTTIIAHCIAKDTCMNQVKAYEDSRIRECS